ncbi:acyl-CoA synthetase (AMP-forming)/AMP-acid ligase II [Micromonospora vinacea]|uniref:Acyl-CoA synthetase (AMP-forming)/AMP-acid ligase II n=1 Tax=Micromonospora vinacea TaxID=709878 RepID=A0ABS0KBG6_9ACTN|nr:fatty acyl-AMP ligase [Micromonospora vinacea]MBG6105980.1 acyl-CoA synthetase (AMP-forming)/AMP-acid ligase II [Micromonospora vinacea]
MWIEAPRASTGDPVPPDTVESKTESIGNAGVLPSSNRSRDETFGSWPAIEGESMQGDLVSLAQLLGRNANEHGDRPAVRVGGHMLTWAEVDQRARAVAGLLGRSVAPGDRVVLSFPTDVDFLPALFGCWYAGAVAVPVPPGRAGERTAAHAQASMTVTVEELAEAFPGRCVTVGQAMEASLAPEPAAHEVAVLQYTSGSTGSPKGVLVSHRNYFENLRMLDEFTRSIAPPIRDLQMVCWLPHFHDMGLALLMFTVLRAGTATLIPPMSFVKDPGVWLRTIGEVGGNLTGAPNFAFDLCVQRVPASETAGLDLSSMRVVLNAAEPVRPDTVERFAEHFGPAGFPREAMAPCFGLAEGTVFVSGVRDGDTPRTVRFDRESLQNGVAVEEPVAGWPMVGCGQRPEGLTVRIVDPETLVDCGPGVLGEIWVHGPSVACGYWQRDDNSAVFEARVAGFDEQPHLRTGDRGFLWKGELFVTGRLADLIEIDGWLLHPEDVEHTVERSSPTLHGRRCAVLPYGKSGDHLVVAAEVRLPLPLAAQRRAELESVIREAVKAEHGVDVAAIVLMRTGGLPVTTSGKVQRVKARALIAEQMPETGGCWSPPVRKSAHRCGR